jgi:hypothetical protein
MSMITPCGLDCSQCAIRQIPIDAKQAKEVIVWFKDMGWLKQEEGIKEAIEKKMYCKGCRSDRTDVHWTPDCFILECCIDKKGLEFCYECNEFPCKRLLEWSEQGSRYKNALKNLTNIKEKRVRRINRNSP